VPTCKYCGLSSGDQEFNSNSRVRCKKCLNAYTKQRYHEKYGPLLKATRRTKDQAKKAQPVVLPEVDRAYAAGLIDGEGCIRITSRGLRGGTTFRQGQYTLILELTNTDYGMIEWLQQKFGGSVSYYKEDVALNKRQKWHWRVAANKALYCLDAIWPYIRTKRTQAKLGRRFQRYTQYAGTPATEKRQLLHERFYQEFRVLNKRGLA
jgi:hypothetical protein